MLAPSGGERAESARGSGGSLCGIRAVCAEENGLRRWLLVTQSRRVVGEGEWGRSFLAHGVWELWEFWVRHGLGGKHVFGPSQIRRWRMVATQMRLCRFRFRRLFPPRSICAISRPLGHQRHWPPNFVDNLRICEGKKRGAAGTLAYGLWELWEFLARHATRREDGYVVSARRDILRYSLSLCDMPCDELPRRQPNIFSRYSEMP